MSSCWFFYLATVASGCASVQPTCQLPKDVLFPRAFSALQILKVSSPNAASKRLLAAVERNNNKLRLSLLDGVLQTPIADFQVEDGKIISSELFVNLGASKEEQILLAETISRFYTSANLKCETSDLVFYAGHLKLVAHDLNKFPNCFFPGRIEVRVSNVQDFQIEVTTEELTCQN